MKRLLHNSYRVARNSKIISPCNFTLIGSQNTEKNRETYFWEDPCNFLSAVCGNNQDAFITIQLQIQSVDIKFLLWYPLPSSQNCKKAFKATGLKNRVFRRSNPSCQSIGWMALPCEPPWQKPKNLPYGKVCDADNGDNTVSKTIYLCEKVGASVQKRGEKE